MIGAVSFAFVGECFRNHGCPRVWLSNHIDSRHRDQWGCILEFHPVSASTRLLRCPAGAQKKEARLAEIVPTADNPPFFKNLPTHSVGEPLPPAGYGFSVVSARAMAADECFFIFSPTEGPFLGT